MVTKLHVEGYDAFKETVPKIEEFDKSGKPVFVLFCGSPDKEGHNWCPDCVAAAPVVEKGLEGAPEDAVFVHVGVGERNTWKDPNCSFRTDPTLRLTSVPTLLKWGTPQKLGDSECSKQDLVDMLLQDD
ncbi:unnamed protein product [Owenia fusiformis]|uniref:Thioredoxin domain-containing protein 17 n=1 Tax=Owenia fusiformis TaxID=6347 RepID=A0A8J1YBJ3_OWEFU|nr:unnamed protein product [Owenia fusiformis]